MPDFDVPIVVVDDAKFSSAIIAKLLRGGGFSNVRLTSNPLEALRSLEKHPADIVIADWLTNSMDGVELTRRIKHMDEQNQRFTYVMLMTARDDDDAQSAAAAAGVDDFVNKAHLRTQLLSRLTVAERLTANINTLLKSNRQLSRRVDDLQTNDVVDPVTGLGNEKFTIDRVDAVLRQTQTRGGATCLLLIGINNFDEIIDQFEPTSIDELMSGISVKIRNLVRPLDVVTRVDENIFAVTTLQDSLQSCTSKSFRRIFDSLYMHSFKTSEGYVPVVVGVSITAADGAADHPNAKDFLDFARKGLERSFETGIITVRAYSPGGLMDELYV